MIFYQPKLKYYLKIIRSLNNYVSSSTVGRADNLLTSGHMLLTQNESG